LEENIQPSVGQASAQTANREDGLPVVSLRHIEVLTRAMLKGDEMAWRTFYDAYFNRLCRYLLVIAAGNEDAAREALQAALVRVTRHIKIFRDEKVFWSWLTVLARTAFADETKKHRRYFSFLDRFTLHAEVELDGVNDNQADGRLQTLLECQVALLPPDEQKLIEQKYFTRRAVREIADELQTTEKAVESKLSRVRRKLKDAVLVELKNEQPR
jgi:RNA polymerase sigma-70 factor, ECF subfamily